MSISLITRLDKKLSKTLKNTMVTKSLKTIDVYDVKDDATKQT